MKETNLPQQTSYCCPVCVTPLLKVFGENIHPNDPKFGITLFCLERNCGAAEVKGHGKSETIAYNVILSKFTGTRYETENEPVEELASVSAPVIDVASKPAPSKRGRPAKKIAGLPVVEMEEDLI